jgi:tetratricopeptide (TPR) repeat protein
MERAKDERPELFQRAMDHQTSGRLAEAIAVYERLLQLDDNLAEVHNNLGLALAGLGELDRALAHYDRASELSPELAAVYDNRGLALQLQGAFAEAITCHQRAAALDPSSPQAQLNLANALVRSHLPREAIAPLRRALELQPDLSAAFDCLGRAQHAMGSLDDSIVSYRRAISIAPDFADAHCNLGNALREAGDIGGARASYQRAVDLAPRVGQFHMLLIDAGAPVDERHLQQMEAISKSSDVLTIDDRIGFHFALGDAYGERGDYGTSFQNFLDGNALARSKTVYDETQALREFESLRNGFSAEVIEWTLDQGYGDPSQVPVLIFGMPRSGTTLVEQILAAHPEVHAGGELSAYTPKKVGIFELAQHSRKWIEGQYDVPGTPSSFFEALRKTGARYARYVESLAPTVTRVTDRWPFNFKFVGMLHLALPKARLIHVRRSSLDTCFSCFTTLFSEDLPYTHDLAELGRYYRAYEDLMGFWRKVLPPGAMLEVGYEDLVADFETTARRLIAYCGLEWDERCMDFWPAKRPGRTEHSVQGRERLYDRAIGRSQPYREFLGPLSSALGLRGIVFSGGDLVQR